MPPHRLAPACLASLLAMVALAPPASATPTTVVTDPAGDVLWQAAPPLDDAYLDIRSLAYDSDGTDFVVVLETEDLWASQPKAAYGVSFLLTTSAGTAQRNLSCALGDHGTGAAAPLQGVAWGCGVSVPFVVPGSGAVGGIAFGESGAFVPHAVDLSADTVTVEIPYALLGAVPGDTVGNSRAATCETYGVLSFCATDEAWSPAAFSYTLA